MTTVRDLMTTDPIRMSAESSARDAAQRMKEADIGDVLVEEGGELRGIVTDRDLVVRMVADGTDPDAITIGELCSGDLHVLRPDDDLGEAVRILREHAVRRIPVVDDGSAVGILAIGDLAVILDEESALADISAAPSND